MDPLLMVGGWAAAILSTAAAIRLGIKFGAKAIRAALGDELRKLWRELDDQDRYFHDEIRELRADLASVAQELRPNGGASLRDQLGRVEQMMVEHIRA
jgi:hypothetical protein